MERRPKITFRKVLRLLLTLIVSVGSVVAILSASKKQDSDHIKNVYFKITNEEQYQFLDKKTIEHKLISENNIKANTTPLHSINATALEAMALKDSWVGKAQVYLDNQHNLHISLTQRIPVARVFFENGESKYLDTSLRLLPIASQFSYYTTVVTNLPQYNNDSSNKHIRASVVALVRYVDTHPFWRGQIEHIAVTPDGNFEMYPLLGSHKIIFGDTTLMVSKFERLFGFYKKVLNKIGWNKYTLVDVRYKNQIVASPSLPWKKPPTNAMSNMSWLQSIMEDAPKSETLELPDTLKQQPVAIIKPATPAVPTASATPVKTKQNTTQTPINKKKEKTTTEIKQTIIKPVEKQKEQKAEKKTEQKEHTTPKYIYQEQ